MNLAQLSAAVVIETKRPDMDTFSGGDGTIQQKIVAATLFLHGMDFFLKDIAETLVVFDQAAYLQTLDCTEIPMFRRMYYARKWDPTLQTYQQNPTILPPLFNSVGAVNPTQSLAFFKIIDADHIFDNYNYKQERTDVAYQTGDTLSFKSSSSFAQMLFGYYKFPNTDTSGTGQNFSSWIARDHPFAIIYHATSSIFAMIGKQESSRKYDSPASPVQNGQPGLVQQEINKILLNEVTVQGR